MRRAGAVALFVVVSSLPAAAADERASLVKARTAYNQGDFDTAIAAADDARGGTDLADGADLVAARAFLEKYRASAAPEDLAAARERLRRIRPEHFTPRERLEFIVGLGESLFFDASPAAAATIFDTVLSNDGAIEGRDLVLDWWASAVDQDARPRTEFERQAMYERVRARMAAELARNPASGPAAYWLAAAARGQGDLQTAWGAAQAGWVRALLAADHGAALRGDLDRLVQRVLVPERARLLGQPPEALREDWEQFKAKWSR